MIQFLLCFGLMFGVDWTCARYTKAAAQHRAGVAAGYAMAMCAFGAALTIAYVDNHWMILPALLGAGLGTYLGTKR